MKVLIPSPLQSYTNGVNEVETKGSTLNEVFTNLDIEYPGFRFRIIDEQEQIRTHIKVFVEQAQETNLQRKLNSNQVVQIICSLSGG